MKKKEHKTGDIIKLDEKKFRAIDIKIDGVMTSLDYMTHLLGSARKELWDLIKSEYPEIYKKYRLSFHDCKMKIGKEKDNDY